MTFQHQHWYWLIIALWMLQFSCKPDKDSTAPVVDVSSPSNNQQYDVFDEIPVKASVSDETQLEFVSVRLVDADLQPVQSTLTINPNGNRYELDTRYPIDDFYLTSGTYYLRVKASDGVNETKKYVELFINQADVQPVGTVIISTPNSSTVDVSMVYGQSSSSELLRTVSTDYVGSGISPLFQRIFVQGPNDGLTAIEVGSQGATNWHNEADTYEGFDTQDELNYMCTRNNGIVVLGTDNSPSITMLPDAFYYSTSSFTMDDKLFTLNEERNGTGQKLIVYYTASGTQMQNQTLYMDVVGMARRSSDELWLFGNESGVGKMWSYSLSSNVITHWKDLSSGPLSAITETTSNSFIIAHADEVSYYTYANGSQTYFCGDAGAQRVLYDALQNRIVIADGSTLKFYDFPSGTAAGMVSHGSYIQDIHILNNK